MKRFALVLLALAGMLMPAAAFAQTTLLACAELPSASVAACQVKVLESRAQNAAVPPAAAQQSEMEKQKSTLCARLKAAGGNCKTAQDYALEADQEKKERIQGLLDHHCPSHVHIGIPEACVYLLMGNPDHTNEDLRSGKQLVYPDDTYVYIDTDGMVENVQTSH
jgi:hypothetical protein